MNKKIPGILALAMLMGTVGFGFFKTSLVFAQANPTPTVAEDNDDVDEANEVDDQHEGPDIPITGSALEKASAVALEHVGEGRVTDTEIEDEESYYEVEVRLDNGREVDVQLDENYNVVGTD